MIYLIDDNQNNQRLNNYNISFIETGHFNGYLTSIEKIEVSKKFPDSTHLNFLNSASCILLHTTTEDYDKSKGFIPGSRSNVLIIKEIISMDGEKIPLVLFSNSMGEPEYDMDSNPNYISSIKKNIFYNRLYDFLDYYKDTGKIEMRILAFGKNYLSHEITKIGLLIINQNFENILSSNSLNKFLEIAYPIQNPDNLIAEIKDNHLWLEEFKIKIPKIIESFNKYGKNIYPWK